MLTDWEETQCYRITFSAAWSFNQQNPKSNRSSLNYNSDFKDFKYLMSNVWNDVILQPPWSFYALILLEKDFVAKYLF